MKIFSQVHNRRPKQNKFDLSHEKKLSMKMGNLIPMMVQEILPGDKFRVTSEIMMRLAPMIAPIMHRVNVYTHYFFVPNRIIWNEWEDFITGGKDGTSMPVWPHYKITGTNYQKFQEKQLADYLGLPTLSAVPTASQEISALPFRAYTEIWNEYYRDQNLTDEIAFSKSSGLQTDADLNLTGIIRNRAWEKDYFTSALPWTQRGPEVTIPFSAEVNYKPVSTILRDNGAFPSDGALNSAQLPANPEGSNLTVGSQLARIENIEDITSGTSTINDLRRSVRLQEWLEKNARGGARYIEQLLSHWGKAPKDARLQRPEYLGGGKQPVTISEVLANFGSAEIPQGEMAGHGISVGNTNRFTKTFDEHGYVIGIISVLPRTAYMQGIPKHFMRKDKLEYAWPEFAQLGEQEIKSAELYYDGSAINDDTFGYTPRYSEYKYGISTVHGEMRTNLDHWHIARKFATKPQLTADFVEADPDETKRIFAVTDPSTDDLYVQIYNDVSAMRSLPYFGTPTL